MDFNYGIGFVILFNRIFTLTVTADQQLLFDVEEDGTAAVLSNKHDRLPFLDEMALL